VQALSSRSSPSLLVALLLPLLSFPAFAKLSNKRLSLSRQIDKVLVREGLEKSTVTAEPVAWGSGSGSAPGSGSGSGSGSGRTLLRCPLSGCAQPMGPRLGTSTRNRCPWRSMRQGGYWAGALWSKNKWYNTTRRRNSPPYSSPAACACSCHLTSSSTDVPEAAYSAVATHCSLSMLFVFLVCYPRLSLTRARAEKSQHLATQRQAGQHGCRRLHSSRSSSSVAGDPPPPHTHNSAFPYRNSPSVVAN